MMNTVTDILDLTVFTVRHAASTMHMLLVQESADQSENPDPQL